MDKCLKFNGLYPFLVANEAGVLEAAYRWSCFLIHSATLCLLVGAFKPITFKVIIASYVCSAILLLDYFPLFFFLSVFLLLLKASPLTFVAVLVWCWQSPLAFSYLGSSLFLLQF